MNSARALRQARRRAGLTQRELAARAGVPQSAVARIESGKVVPRVDTLDRLLRVCGDMLEAVPRLGDGVDRTLIHETLKQTPGERVRAGARAAEAIAPLTGALRR